MDFDGLAIDLDGTLLVGEDLPANNITAVRAARDAGFKIIIATARWHQMALRVAAELEIEGPVIACSGAQVHDPYDFSRSVRVALREFGPARLVLPGPGTSLASIVGQILVAEQWRGIDSRAAFDRARENGELPLEVLGA